MKFKLPFYTVAKGEDGAKAIKKLAKTYGYQNVLEIWKHADNSKLRKKRTSPDKLEAGDVLFLPVPKSLKKPAREHLDSLISSRDSILRQQTDLAKRIEELKWRNGVLKGFVQQIMTYNKNYVVKISKLVDDAVKARDTADLIQNTAMLGAGPLKSAAHAFRKKFLKKSLKKSDTVISTLQKGAEKQLDKLDKASRSMFSADYNKALSQVMAVNSVGSMAVGSTGFIMDALTNESSADSLVGQSLRVLDDATSVAYWGWVALGVVDGNGWDSFKSVQSDAKKKIRKVSAMCADASAEILRAMALHDKSISGFQKHYKLLDNQIAKLERAMDYPTGVLAAK